MLQKTEAIALKKQDLRETSLFLTFYTRDFGKLYGVMKGVRGQKGQYGLPPQLFSLNELVFYERRNKDVFTISQCELRDFFAEARESLEKTSYALYFIELINSLTAAGDKNADMFELLENSLRLLCSHASTKRIARVFEIKLLNILGLMPELKRCVICGLPIGDKAGFSFKNGGVVCKNCFAGEKAAFPILTGTMNFIEHINRADWERVARIKVSQDVGQEVEKLLNGFLGYHLQIKPKTLEFIRKAQIGTD